MKNFRFYWEEDKKKDASMMIDVPGFGKDEIKVKLTSSSIEISASKKSQKQESGKGFYRAEAFASSFARSMTLPRKIDPKDYEVEIRDGQVALKKKSKKEEKKADA